MDAKYVITDELEQLVKEAAERVARSVKPWPEWLSDKTAADYASVSTSTVERWRRAGLNYHIVGGLVRMRRGEIDSWIASHTSSRSCQC